MIVKLANIELTPENPEHNGGSWHIEGQLVSCLCCHLYVLRWMIEKCRSVVDRQENGAIKKSVTAAETAPRVTCKAGAHWLVDQGP